MKFKKDLEKSITEALNENNFKYTDSNNNDKLNKIFNSFFNSWYKKKGVPYYFIFKKNIKVTNIQFAELLSLFKTFTTLKDDYITTERDSELNIQFFRTNDFKVILENMIQSFASSKNKNSNKYNVLIANKIADEYSTLFLNSVIIDPLHGSCQIYCPPQFEVKLKLIVGYSGYIHSCGYLIFSRNVNKAKSDSFYSNIWNYCFHDMKNKPFYKVSENKDCLRKITQFIAYCHEDFTPYDRDLLHNLSNGLDEIKFYMEKYFMGDESMSQIINNLESYFEENDKNQLSQKITVQTFGNYNHSRNSFLYSNNSDYINLLNEREKVKKDNNGLDLNRNFEKEIEDFNFIENKLNSEKHTIFLVIDKIFPTSINTSEKYYICYDQVYTNHNPFQIFDENKPGWIDHTTIPHSLMGAMINLTLPSIIKNRKKSIKICDPFLGSGTTFLETMKFKGNLQKINFEFHGRDGSSLINQVVYDNLNFFRLPTLDIDLKNEYERLLKDFYKTDEVKNLIIDYIEILKNNDDIIDKLLSDFIEEYEYKIIKNKNTFKLTVKSNFIFRLQIYLVRKVIKRKHEFLKRLGVFNKDASLETLEIAYKELIENFKKEATSLIHQIKYFHNYNSKTKKGKEEFGLINFTDNYSLAIALNLGNLNIKNSKRFYKQALISKESINICDQDMFDIVITDPPYGFNTSEDLFELSKTYSILLDRALKGFSNNGHGQLILCLPEKSFNGHKTHFFTLINLIKHQINQIAKKHKLVIIYPTSNLPTLFKAPYYWESEKALRRTIVHYYFKKE